MSNASQAEDCDFPLRIRPPVDTRRPARPPESRPCCFSGPDQRRQNARAPVALGRRRTPRFWPPAAAHGQVVHSSASESSDRPPRASWYAASAHGPKNEVPALPGAELALHSTTYSDFRSRCSVEAWYDSTRGFCEACGREEPWLTIESEFEERLRTFRHLRGRISALVRNLSSRRRAHDGDVE